MPTTILRLFLQAVGLLAGLFGALLLVDLWRASRPDAHATYHFGAEAMIAHGGAKYASQAAYLADAVPMTLLTLAVAAGCLLLSTRLRRRSSPSR